jgi:hypothetical protein
MIETQAGKIQLYLASCKIFVFLFVVFVVKLMAAMKRKIIGAIACSSISIINESHALQNGK